MTLLKYPASPQLFYYGVARVKYETLSSKVTIYTHKLKMRKRLFLSKHDCYLSVAVVVFAGC